MYSDLAVEVSSKAELGIFAPVESIEITPYHMDQ